MRKVLVKSVLLFMAGILVTSCGNKDLKISSPDGRITVTANASDGKLLYDVRHLDNAVLLASELGLIREDADFYTGMKIQSVSPVALFTDEYELIHGKQRKVTYEANEATLHAINEKGERMDVIFRVSNDGVGFRYYFPDVSDEVKKLVEERTSFNFPAEAHAWLQPMSKAKSGWARTNPSYEEDYLQDIPVGTESPLGAGWVYPALFNSNGSWVLITEAALADNYCGTKLVNEVGSAEYRIGFPQPEEIFPGGALNPESELPWYSPWRVITIGDLKTITESTLGTDLADPQMEGDFSWVKPGLASWSWAILKDPGTNYDTQIRFIDYAADMQWSYCLIDANWDETIGYDRIQELLDYGAEKGVEVLLWYNSAGDWNDTPQTPKDLMLTSESRQSEFERIHNMGIAGVKVDFFGGDGQSVIEYYHAILQDAAKYKINVNFHGTTLPRGWHRTYPHMLTSEAIKGFEFITFGQATANNAPTHMAMAPFTRNVFDPMDFTSMCLYEIPGIKRQTSNGFEMASVVVYTSGIHHIAETDTGMATVPDEIKEFLVGFPGTWDEMQFMDGYPGKFAVIARRANGIWYVGGFNGQSEPISLDLDFSFLNGNKSGYIINDGDNPLELIRSNISINPSERVNVEIGKHGGFVMMIQ